MGTRRSVKYRDVVLTSRGSSALDARSVKQPSKMLKLTSLGSMLNFLRMQRTKSGPTLPTCLDQRNHLTLACKAFAVIVTSSIRELRKRWARNSLTGSASASGLAAASAVGSASADLFP